jgi:D-xylonolactonase
VYNVLPEVVVDLSCQLGEGPLWHPVEKRLYWLDYPMGRIYRYDPASGGHELAFQGARTAGFTFQADGGLLLFMDGPSVAILHDGELSYVFEGLPDEAGMHFNDALADPKGRVFSGTVPNDRSRIADKVGKLYRLDTDGSATPVADGIGISNGMAFTPDGKQMYYTDSYTRTIYMFDYDEDSGEISNRRVFVKTAPDGGLPDGMTVDAEGYVWSARWDEWVLCRFAPDGTEERRIRFPAKKVSSVTFGGADYSDIYVTTAGGDQRNGEGASAGALFRLKVGIRGRQEHFSRVSL